MDTCSDCFIFLFGLIPLGIQNLELFKIYVILTKSIPASMNDTGIMRNRNTQWTHDLY